jgi:hypothetical protein
VRAPATPPTSTWAAGARPGWPGCSRASSSPNWLSSRSAASRPARDRLLAPGLLALVDPLLKPGLDSFPAVSHVPAYPIADWTITPVPPAIQGMNRDA